MFNFLFFLTLSQGMQTTVDPYMLTINSNERISISINNAYNSHNGNRITLKEIARMADGKRFVAIGEQHDNFDSHRWQNLIINALIERGRRVIVGFEMYQRHKQHYLNLWTLGKLTEEEFLEKSDWSGQWGFDFGLYRPIFETVQKNTLRAVALNVPRDWVRTASREGYDALPEEAKQQLPEMDLTNQNHYEVFRALMGGHPGDAMLENVYRGQVLWDEAMADSAIKYLDRTIVDERTVFVIIAGNGHVMYKQGIDYRIHKRTGMDCLTVVTIPIEGKSGKRRVSAGLGDIIIGVRPNEK